MIEKVIVTRYRAKDGSLHDSEAAVLHHDRFVFQARVKDEIIEVLQKGDTTPFHSLSETIFPYNSNDYHDSDITYQRDQFWGELADILMDKWDDLKKVIENNS